MRAVQEARTLSREATVPRSLVHKSAIHEVLLADARQLEDNEFVCSGQLPRAHRFYNDIATGYHDPIVVLEAGRQAGVLIAHRYLQVPSGHQFIFRSLEFEVDDVEPLALRREPPAFLLALAFYEPKLRRGELVGGRLRAEVTVDGRRTMRMWGEAAFVARRAYERFRRDLGSAKAAGARAESLIAADPRRVGRELASNVVVTRPRAEQGRRRRATLLIDQDHPTLFDHPLDHVPGMLLAEGIRQLAIATAGELCAIDPRATVVSSCRLEYLNIAELGPPVEAVASVADSGRSTASIEVVIEQARDEIARGQLRLHQPAPWDGAA